MPSPVPRKENSRRRAARSSSELGGHAASAWKLGVMTGLADEGIDVRGADLFVGTSAGSRVAVQITSGLPLEDLFQRQADPRQQAHESLQAIDFKQRGAALAAAKTRRRRPERDPDEAWIASAADAACIRPLGRDGVACFRTDMARAEYRRRSG